jgi:heme A synthase
MTRTLSVTAAIVLAALLSVQFARGVLQLMAEVPSSVVTTAPAAAPAADGTATAIEDLAGWPMAAVR